MEPQEEVLKLSMLERLGVAGEGKQWDGVHLNEGLYQKVLHSFFTYFSLQTYNL